MALGPKDRIDELLIRKYSDQQVDNHSEDYLTSMVNPDKMMGAMKDYAEMSRYMTNMKFQLQQACSSVNARFAQYKPTNRQNYQTTAS